jgi:hypothetical protein
MYINTYNFRELPIDISINLRSSKNIYILCPIIGSMIYQDGILTNKYKSINTKYKNYKIPKQISI